MAVCNNKQTKTTANLRPGPIERWNGNIAPGAHWTARNPLPSLLRKDPQLDRVLPWYRHLGQHLRLVEDSASRMMETRQFAIDNDILDDDLTLTHVYWGSLAYSAVDSRWER
jgi:hypothetical protein